MGGAGWWWANEALGNGCYQGRRWRRGMTEYIPLFAARQTLGVI